MSSLSENAPLSALAASLMENDVSPSPMRSSHHMHHDSHCGHGWWSFVFYFLVIALVLYFTFFALRPSFVLEDKHHSYSHGGYSSDDYHDDREINNGKLLGSAIVGALIIIFVFWLLWWLVNGSW